MNNLISQSVKVPHRSSHYLGYHNILTVPIGTLVPLCCQPLVPNTKVHLKTLLSASLAPLASDTFLRTSLKVEAFFCPMRLLYGGYEHWLTRDVVYPAGSSQYSQRLGVRLPCISLSTADFKTISAVGTLADYLGVRLPLETDAVMAANDTVRLNYFPFAAYHYICDTWYNRADVQLPLFRRPSSGGSTSSFVNWPYITHNGISATDYSVTPVPFAATDELFKLRQRNFPIDYFTSSMLSPQVGDAEGITIDTSGSSTQVSVASLRAANSLQVWRERIGLSGPRLVDYVRAHYGADLSDGNARRPMYLGSGSVEFYSRGVDMTVNDQNQQSIATINNPFRSVGARFGNGSSNGEVSLVDNFIAEEPGYLMVMISVVPKVTYSSGILRYMQHYTHNGCETDLANPILQNIGNQEVNMSELAAVFGGESTRGSGYIFGYQQRYAEYMYREDECHGLFIDTQSLESFVSQRNVTANTKLSSSFLEIPKTYLDQVSAQATSVGTYGAMVDSYVDLSVSQPLFESSVPSLVNPMEEHGKNVVVMRGGKRII